MRWNVLVSIGLLVAGGSLALQRALLAESSSKSVPTIGGQLAPVTGHPSALPVASGTRVGMNLANVTYYGTEFPFIDRMKAAGAWSANGASEPVPLTTDGYPIRIPAGATSAYTMIGLDPSAADYVLLYEGPSTPYLQGARVTKKRVGRVEFHYDGTAGNQMLLAIGGGGFRKMRVMRAEHEALLAAGQVFNPAFLAKIHAFDTLRYMDWVNTNGTTVVHWADRTQPGYRTFQGSGDSTMPIEVMVALANQTHTNMWLNVPTRADDDYVRQLLTYVRDHLDPSLTVRVEYSNEVWNWGFQQAAYAHIEAAKLWGTDANHDGRIDPTDKAEQFGQGWVTWYGYRSAQVAAIARQVFGTDALPRLRCVIATQTTYIGLESVIFDGVGRAKLGSVNALFNDYAVTTYFDGMLRGANAADQATILAWARGGNAGMTAAFAALANGVGLTAKDEGSLAYLRGVLVQQGAIAKAHGLSLVAYEGGIDLTGGEKQGAEVVTFMRRLQADPRMGIVYRRMVTNFRSAGGTLLIPLIDVDAGLWGHLKSIYDTGSPAWDALVATEEIAAGAQPFVPTQRGGSGVLGHVNKRQSQRN